MSIVKREYMQYLLKCLRLFLVSLPLIVFSLIACNRQEGPTKTNSNLEATATQTFDVYKDASNSSLYHADSTTTNSSYTGTLKEVVEDAVDELNSDGGGKIAFRAGMFNLGSDFFLIREVDNIIFEGKGIDVTIIKNSSNASKDTEPFNFGKSNNITIRGLTVLAGGSPRNTSDAIDGDDANNWLIEDIKIGESRGCAVIVDGKGEGQTANGNIIRNCIIDGVPNGGIQLLASSNNLIENCTITNITDGKGIAINKSSSVADQPNKPSNDNIIRNNTIENTAEEGIRVRGGSRNTITGNSVKNSSSDGIKIDTGAGIACNDNIIGANTSTNNDKYGLNINSATCKRTVVQNNNNFTGNGSGKINDDGTDTIYESGEDIEPPTAPQNLTATNVQANQVTLSWDASTDNVGVTRYDIYRNNLRVAQVNSLTTTARIKKVNGSTTTYTDRTVVANASYRYRVRAKDAAGNRSSRSNRVNVTTPPTSTSTMHTFTPVADTTIRISDRDRNYGNGPTLEVDGDSKKDTLLRFRVTDVGTSSDNIQKAVLRLYATNGSPFGGKFVQVNNNTWKESTVTWNNAPPANGISLGSLGDVDAGQWYELDVTQLISGDGRFSIRISSSNSNGADYASRENSNGKAPKLIVTTN